MKIGTADIFNPKQETDVLEDKEDRLFPYYAGYSKRFAVNFLRSLELAPSSVVFDPWNGSGTTTRAASELGLHAVGCDL
ncbi:MAG TPA: DNA methyltransferase, partial [Burkholderiaceae bacterium]